MQTRASISGQTAITVILAHPVAHVRAPQAMNAHYDALGYDGVLVPLQVLPEDLATVVAGLRRLRNLRGIVVTVPHKEAIASLCDELTADARQVGAVNVIRREEDGRLTGGQFDGEGFVAGLRGAGHEVTGRAVFMAGAGGAAAGLAFALARHGARRLTIHNRTAAKAEELAARVRAAYPACDTRAGGADPSGHDIVANATSLGMHEGDALPLEVARLAPPMLAAEVIMAPEVTPFLAEAAKRGCATHGGKPMLTAQIALLARFMGAIAVPCDR
ncbi:shikimate dehydrogenase [Roseomonas eburnea]|uniref:shikimate dehydrogenase (NADP(+)) n=1 Tax=Neoroseomonas eburnea TaxID=1346889 RepID=A0A9X9XFR6_9PROT|nr:shikimate dehydrogenase [Neoroseomonas eburnea]MBR0682552.1 shikimate dehydrogenase [Neoroseomonas eburnea]